MGNAMAHTFKNRYDGDNLSGCYVRESRPVTTWGSGAFSVIQLFWRGTVSAKLAQQFVTDIVVV